MAFGSNTICLIYSLFLKEVDQNFSTHKAGDGIIQIDHVLLKDFKQDASYLLKGAKKPKSIVSLSDKLKNKRNTIFR
jgi:hypothetical protein